MAKVRRANVILDIKDSEIDFYLTKGFNVIDEVGNVIREAIPNDATALKAAYYKHIDEIKALKAENEKLKKSIKSLEKKLKNEE